MFTQCYERILSVDPVNVQGLHNLCVVYVERGELPAAETCLERAHAIAPAEDYILRHLNIVRSRLAKHPPGGDSGGHKASPPEEELSEKRRGNYKNRGRGARKTDSDGS